MNKIQKLNFDTVDDFLDHLPDHERKIVDCLRRIIFDCIPGCTEKLAYNVPFYYRHARICFIWPSSIPWGRVKPNGVQLGFCNGNLLIDDAGYLEKGDRKQVYTKTFTSVKDIDVDMVRTYIFDAVAIDEQIRKNKRAWT